MAPISARLIRRSIRRAPLTLRSVGCVVVATGKVYEM
jgi:hypothetical protein